MKTLQHPIIRLSRLSPGRWWMLVEAAFCLVGARIAVQFVPFDRIGRHLGPLRPPLRSEGPATPTDVQVANDVRWAVNAVAGRSPLEMVCLPRALAAWRMLQRRGVASRLHFGAPLQPGKGGSVQTHAWLSSSGVEVTGYPAAYGCVEVGFFGRPERAGADTEGVAIAAR